MLYRMYRQTRSKINYKKKTKTKSSTIQIKQHWVLPDQLLLNFGIKSEDVQKIKQYKCTICYTELAENI